MEDIEIIENEGSNDSETWTEFISDNALITDGTVYYGGFRKWSWNLARKQWYALKYLVIWLISWAIWLVAGFLDMWLSSLLWMDEEESISLFQGIASFILWIWLLWFSLNIARWLFQKVDNFFREITWDRIRKVGIWNLLYGFIVIWGLFLLIIPWIIFWTRFSFMIYAIIDKWLWPIEALKYSWRMTKWYFWEIVWFWIYFGLINFLWVLCAIIGVIWTSAMTNMAIARYYRLLSNLYEKTNWTNNNLN